MPYSWLSLVDWLGPWLRVWCEAWRGIWLSILLLTWLVGLGSSWDFDWGLT